MKIAVTGASGFIGRRLANYLVDRGHQVAALLRTMPGEPFWESDQIVPLCGDVTEKESLFPVFKDRDVVIHLAALFNRPDKSWDDYYNVNVQGAINVLEAARDAGVKKVIHCSTGGVVSGNPHLPFTENDPYAVPESDKYEKTKCEGEKAVLAFSEKYAYPLIVLRPTQPYGPGDLSKAKFYRLVKRGVIFNPGKTKKHLIYIDDLCRAFETAAVDDRAVGEIIHVGGPEALLLRNLIGHVANALDVPYPRIVMPAHPMAWVCSATEQLCNLMGIKPVLYRRSMDFFLKSVEFETAKAQSLLGFTSSVDVPTGIKNTAEWYRRHNLI